jgi:hypothetical protein
MSDEAHAASRELLRRSFHNKRPRSFLIFALISFDLRHSLGITSSHTQTKHSHPRADFSFCNTFVGRLQTTSNLPQHTTPPTPLQPLTWLAGTTPRLVRPTTLFQLFLHFKLTPFTAAAGGGFTADESTSTAWAPKATTSGGDGFEDDTGYIGQNVSKHAGDDSGCRK